MANTNTFVGSKIKGIRESKNLSIEEIAESSGLSVEQINSIENDQNLPSLGPLIKIARALGVRLGTFMDDNDALGPVVCRAADRERNSSISFSNGATDARKHMEYHPLAQQKAGRHMEPFVIDINPEENPDFKLSAHEGEEFIYVMNGEVEIEYGKEKYLLKPAAAAPLPIMTQRFIRPRPFPHIRSPGSGSPLRRRARRRRSAGIARISASRRPRPVRGRRTDRPVRR